MSIRTLTLITLAMVTGSSTGCGGMKNFLFGRGAPCGLCNRIGAVGTALNPLAPSPVSAPAPCGPAPNRGCGLFNRGPAVPPPGPYAPYASAPTCHDGCVGSGYDQGGYAVGTAGRCESCNSYGAYHEGGVVDPYLNGTVTEGPVVNGQYQGGPIQGDNFYDRNNYRARKFDSQGDEIISEGSMPTGARYID